MRKGVFISISLEFVYIQALTHITVHIFNYSEKFFNLIMEKVIQ